MIFNKPISSSFILKSWWPLALAWAFMALEGPFITSLIARGEEAQYNLAALSISFALSLLIESPIIMMMAASLRLVKGEASFLKLRNFSHALCLSITLLMFFILLPQPYKLLSKNILHLDDKLAAMVHTTLWFFLPWPGIIGYRRFYQGLLISDHKNKFVTLGTLARFLSLALSYFVFSKTTNLTGSVLAGLSMSVGVISEALLIRFFSTKTIASFMENKKDKSPDYFEIVVFYYPLALTSLIALSSHPIGSYAATQALLPLKSLAVLPLLTSSFIFFFKALSLSFQEVVISLIGEKQENYKELKKFALALGVSLSIIFVVLVYSPFSYEFFHYIFGLSPELTNFVLPPLKLMVLVPALSAYICWMRAVFISLKKTLFLTYISISEVLTIALSLVPLIVLTKFSGAVCIALAFLLGRGSAALCSCLLNLKKAEEAILQTEQI